MNFFIDIGNSRLKCGEKTQIHAENNTVSCWDNNNLQACFADWEARKIPEKIFAACVSNAAIKSHIDSWVQHNWEQQITYATTKKNMYGLTIAYSKPQQLGVDRWLSMLAAWQLFHRAILIIDCGTATTIDMIDDKGQHLGGFILPGFKLMQKALDDNIAAQHIKPYTCGFYPDKGALGLSNETQIQIVHGALLAIAAFIDRAVGQIHKSCDIKPHCIITGGDAEYIKAHVDTPLKHIPNLVLRGLQFIAEQS